MVLRIENEPDMFEGEDLTSIGSPAVARRPLLCAAIVRSTEGGGLTTTFSATLNCQQQLSLALALRNNSSSMCRDHDMALYSQVSVSLARRLCVSCHVLMIPNLLTIDRFLSHQRQCTVTSTSGFSKQVSSFPHGNGIRQSQGPTLPDQRIWTEQDLKSSRQSTFARTSLLAYRRHPQTSQALAFCMKRSLEAFSDPAVA